MAHTLRAAGTDASEDGTGRGTPLVLDRGANKGMTGGTIVSKDICPAHVTAEPHVVFQATGAFRAGGVSLSAGDDDGSNQVVAFNWREDDASEKRRVRRLTPTECLRLMGQPDDFLDLDPPLSDSVKYRLCGNSVVRTVAAWLGRRVAADLEGVAP